MGHLLVAVPRPYTSSFHLVIVVFVKHFVYIIIFIMFIKYFFLLMSLKLNSQFIDELNQNDLRHQHISRVIDD